MNQRPLRGARLRLSNDSSWLSAAAERSISTRSPLAAHEADRDPEMRRLGKVDLAGFIIAAWHGTLLRMKVERTPAAVDRFIRVLADLI